MGVPYDEPMAKPAPEQPSHPGELRDQAQVMINRCDERIAWLEAQLMEANASRRMAVSSLEAFDASYGQPPTPTQAQSSGAIR